MRAHTACFFLTGFALALPAPAAEVGIADDAMLELDGRRVFVVGLYENVKDDALLDRVAQAGFNLVNCPADAAALDRLEARGLYGWVNTGASIDFSEQRETREPALREMAAKLAGHPALLVWEVPDEALWNCWYTASTWRLGDEPGMLREKVAAVKDAAEATRLEGMRVRAVELAEEGRYAESEQIADDIWRRLGEEPPHPGLNLSNAPEREAKMAEGLRAGYDALRALDSKHPIWMNHAPRNSIAQLTRFGLAADIVGCDIYPVPEFLQGHSDLADRSLSCVGTYTQRMQASAPGKPVWMVLQGFGWADLDETGRGKDRARLVRPTLEQSRFMAYDAIANGARGILYWGTSVIEKDSQLWRDLMALAEELKGLQGVLASKDAKAPTVTCEASFGSLDRGIRVLAKAAPEGTWYIVVNEAPEPLTYTLHDLDAPDGTRYREVRSGVETPVTGGRYTSSLIARGVQVLGPVAR